MPPYSPPALYIAIAFLAIILLVVAARCLPALPTREGAAPSPFIVGIMTAILGMPWAAFVLMGFDSFPKIPFEAALAAGCGWCLLTLMLMYRWTSTDGWGDRQRFAVVFGGVLACVVGGFVVFKVGGALRIDWTGKAVLNAAAIVWLVAVGCRVGREY